MSGGSRHPECLGCVGEPKRTFELEERRKVERVIDRRDRICRLVLQDRKDYPNRQNFIRLPDVSSTERPDHALELTKLYNGFQRESLVPLWTEIGDLMPQSPAPRAVPHRWKWERLYAAAARSGELVPVGRGGERRAIALANPGLDGAPYCTPTLWAAIQYLNARESAPVHRHSQHAFRFVVEGEGVATVVNGDAVPMRRGDFLPQAGWNWHSHVNESDLPMAWIDGLDIPLQRHIDSTFFEPGASADPEHVDIPETATSQSERLWGHIGLRPLADPDVHESTPLLAYRWEVTDAALEDQLALEAEGVRSTVGPGHAAVRYVNPTTGGDVLPTMRAEFHRFRPRTATPEASEVGSSVFQVFEGAASVAVGDERWEVERGDLFVVPSWQPIRISTDDGIDLFRFSDSPVIERLGLDRSPLWGACSQDADIARRTVEPTDIATHSSNSEKTT